MRTPDASIAGPHRGGGIDGGDGAYFANAGEDVHAVGSLAPLASLVACIVIRPHGSRNVARVQPDPLVQQPTDRDRRF